MNLDAKFFIKGEQHPQYAPVNWLELEVIATFERGAVQASLSDGQNISSTNIVFAGEGAKRIFRHLDGGIDLTTGGAFEALPFDFVFETKTSNLKLEYYIDFTKDHKIYRDGYGPRVECQIVKRKSIDWLYENADYVSFAYLYDIGELIDELIHEINYTIERGIEPEKVFFTALTFAFVLEGVKEMVKEIADILSGVAGVFPVIKALLQTFPTLLKHITTIIAFIALIKSFSENVISRIGLKHNGAFFRDLLTVGCAHLDLKFQSTILEGPYRQMFLLPAKNKRGFINSDDQNYGYPGRNSSVYNLGSMLRVLMDMFNARIRIKDGTLMLERRDFWRSMTNYTLPSTKLPPYSLNTGDLYVNYILRFITDPSDRNTLENVDDLNFQNTIEPKIKIDKDLNLLKSSHEKTIPLAHGYRKNELSWLQKIFNAITKPVISVANALLSAFNEVRKALDRISRFIKKLKKALKFIGVKVNVSSGNDPGDPKPLKIETIENRLKGSLMLSDHTFNEDKVFLMKDGKVTEDSFEKLSAEYLFKNYHSVNGFDPKYNNQGKIYENVNIPFCLEHFISLVEFNGFKTSDGKDGEMLEIKWRFKSNFALVDFILFETYTNNFRNVTPPDKIVIEEETENKARYHGDGYSDEHD